MKHSLTEASLKRLLNHLLLIGISCNIFVGLSSVYIKDYFLLSLCLFLACCTAVAYVMSITDKSKIGVNIMLCSYTAVFTFASFTPLASYPLMLLFPMVIGLSNLFHDSWKIKGMYIFACVVGCISCMVNSHLHTYGSIDLPHVLNSVLIGTGLITAFIVITELQGRMTNSYQTELEENQDNILKKNKSLKEYIKSNLQLENFAYLASHELKTPIKNISSFSQLLEKKLRGKLDYKEKELFEMVKLETWRMNDMMADLLKLSQLSKTKIEFVPVEGQDFIDSFLDRQFREEKKNITVKNFPTQFYAAESHLNLLFLNLIDNALKFRDKSKKNHVVLDCQENNNEYLFSIADNGIGIADDYKERVFLIFKKLNKSNSFAGSGVGLSMCKEIVERHKGQIWMEDNPAGGNIVKFTIAKDLGMPTGFGKKIKRPMLEVVA